MRRIREKRRLYKEMNDSIFIAQAVKTGDLKAIEIYKLTLEINKLNSEIKCENEYSKEAKIKLTALWCSLKVQRDCLLYRYNLQSKKARIYLDDLKRQKAESKNMNYEI